MVPTMPDDVDVLVCIKLTTMNVLFLEAGSVCISQVATISRSSDQYLSGRTSSLGWYAIYACGRPVSDTHDIIVSYTRCRLVLRI
jgi:hypothetical protein